VSLAWARSRRPILIALLAGLKGLYLDETEARPVNGGDVIGKLATAEIALDWTQTADDCRNLANRIASSASPLDSWEQWNAFCNGIPDTLLAGGTSDLKQAKRDLLKANFNPNSALNKFAPNRSFWKSIDKMDLLAYSTEFSLLPVHGHGIESVGRVLAPDGRLLAGRTLAATVSGPSVLRLTTQREFVCEDLGDPDRPGDETGLRLPGAPGFITESTGMDKTWGHRLDAMGLYPGSWLDGDSQGLSLQSYPEPCVDTGGGLALNPADYDGHLQLATVETAVDDFYGVTTPTRDMKMLGRFDDGLDLDVFDGPHGQNLTDTLQVTTSELGNGLFDPAKPNTLFPDGCYSEKDRTPAYPDAGNAHGLHGVMSFWVKRGYDWKQPAVPLPFPGCGRGRTLVTWDNLTDQTGAFQANTSQLFRVTHLLLGGYGSSLLYFFFESGHDPGDVGNEHQFIITSSPLWFGNAPVRRWSLKTLYWDFRSPSAFPHDCGEFVVNAGTPPGPLNFRCSNDTYFTPTTDPALASDITLPDWFGPHRIALGDRPFQGQYWNGPLNLMPAYVGTGADTTFDEFAIYDFGGAGPLGVPAAAPDVLGSPVTLAGERYKDGRYAKGWKHNPTRVSANPVAISNEAPCYFSPPLALPPGSVLRTVAWTWYKPQDLPNDYAEVALVQTGGNAYLWGPLSSRSTSDPAWTVARQVWHPERVPGEPFRVQILFRRRIPLGGVNPDDESQVPNIPVLDSPVFDDLTFLYQAADEPRILHWHE
jgi:hypothetical protein